MTIQWAESTPAEANRLTSIQIDSWREQGYALVHDLLPADLLQAARDDASAFFPAPDTEASAQIDNFGSDQRLVFPANSSACNDITLHPQLLQAVADLLNLSPFDIRLTQSDLWVKYGRPPSDKSRDNQDQRIHCDYPNHSLTHPPPWHQPDAVEIIIYLDREEDCCGSTAVVPRQGSDDPAYPWPIIATPGVAGLAYVNNRTVAEAYMQEQNPAQAEFRESHLYAREKQARYQFGSVLLYRHDTWHRGTPLKPGAMRLVHNLTFKRADAEWVNVLHPGWSWSMYRRDQLMEKLIASSSPEQRAVLGFPAPGHSYWSPATIDAVEARFSTHGIDMSPYREKIAT